MPFSKLTNIIKRKRVKFLYIAVAIVTLIWVLSRSIGGSGDIEIESTLIDEDKKASWFLFFAAKTKPFLETEAAETSNRNQILNNFANLDLEAKTKLIDEVMEPFDTKRYNFLTQVFLNIHKHKPEIPQLSTYNTDERIYHARYNSKKEDSEDNRIVFNEEYLSSFLHLSDDELQAMKKSHSGIVKTLPNSKTMPKDIYQGDGIVFVGGGKFNFLTLLSIKAIRDLGSNLPIEILVPTVEEFEPHLCLKVFPNYNARCILLPSVINRDPKKSNIFQKFEFKGYQYKALALLFSSFERILFLDGDNTIIRNPDELFTSKPFTDHGLIVWPDFWKRATSPYYYDIADIKIDKTKFLPRYNELKNDYEDVDYTNHLPHEIPFHQYKGAIPDPTNESGQLLLNKETHLDVLILALYYNLFGPSHYYPLFSQGSDGEGDKETFLAACVGLGRNFYQVKTFLRAMGYFDSKLNFIGTGMGQYNPINDFNNATPDLMFIHSNFPKLDPWDLKVKQKITEEGVRLRLYGNKIKTDIHYDFEKQQWQNMKFFICDSGISFDIFKDVNPYELCDEIDKHLEFLEETSSLTQDAF